VAPPMHWIFLLDGTRDHALPLFSSAITRFKVDSRAATKELIDDMVENVLRVSSMCFVPV
jgi:hypothetical protein